MDRRHRMSNVAISNELVTSNRLGALVTGLWAGALASAALGAEATPSGDVAPPPQAADEGIGEGTPIDDGGADVPQALSVLAGAFSITVSASSRAGTQWTSADVPILDGIAQGGTGASVPGVATKGVVGLNSHSGETAWIDVSVASMVSKSCSDRACAGRVTIASSAAEPITVAVAEERLLSVYAARYDAELAYQLTPIEGDIHEMPTGFCRIAPGTYRLDLSYAATDDGAFDLSVQLFKPIEGDLDGDGWIGPADLAELLSEWGSGACGLLSDLTNDCVVDQDDVIALMQVWMTADDQ